VALSIDGHSACRIQVLTLLQITTLSIMSLLDAAAVVEISFFEPLVCAQCAGDIYYAP